MLELLGAFRRAQSTSHHAATSPKASKSRKQGKARRARGVEHTARPPLPMKVSPAGLLGLTWGGAWGTVILSHGVT